MSDLSYGLSVYVEYGISFGVPVISSFFVLLVRFYIVELSDFFVVRCAYSFLVTFLIPLSFLGLMEERRFVNTIKRLFPRMDPNLPTLLSLS